MSRWLRLAPLALLLAALLALAATGGLREALVVPLLYLVWLVGVLFQSIPQAIVWGGLVAVALLAAWRSLAQPPGHRVPKAAPGRAGRAAIAEWAGLIESAPADHYTRWLLAARLAQLAVTLLAGEEAARGRPPWQYLESASLAMPGDVRDYLRAGRQSYQPPPRRLWPRAPGPAAQPDPLELDPAIVIDFFEQSLHTTIGAAYEPGRD